jgi:hypothetical protein
MWGTPLNEVKSKRRNMTSTVKIRTTKAIDLLNDSIKVKKTELDDLNKAVAQYKKDYKAWEDKTIKEAKKAALSSGRITNGSSGGTCVTFTFKATSSAPKGPEEYVVVKEKGYNYTSNKKELLQKQIQKSEALLTMLKLTEDEFVSATVYKDITSML